MAKKFFETDSFVKVQAEWAAKLKQSGFNDLEDAADPDAYIQPEIISKKSRYGFDEEHFELCQSILRDYPFREDLQRAIFELHAEGKSIREIEQWLSENSTKRLGRNRIHEIIKRIKEDFGRV